jgi:hypothetical protein
MVSLNLRPLSDFKIAAQKEDVPVKSQVVSHCLFAVSDFYAGSRSASYFLTDQDTRYFFPQRMKRLIT